MALLPQDPKDQKLLLAGVAPLLLILAYNHFVGTPRSERTATLRTHVESLETQNATARTIAQQQGGPQLEARVAQLEHQVDRLERLVPRKEEVPQLLRDISLRARETSLQLTRLKPETEEAGDRYVKRTYEINVEGPYHAIGVFLSDIGSLSRIMTPTDLKLITNTGRTLQNGAPVINASFRLLTYFAPPAGESPEDHLSGISEAKRPEPPIDVPAQDTTSAAMPDSIPTAAPDSTAPDTTSRTARVPAGGR